IATAGAGMMQHLDPPSCHRYIILADHGEAGQQAASELAGRLLTKFPRCAVPIATPQPPEGGEEGYDWKDALIHVGSDSTSIAEMRRAILEAPSCMATEVDRQGSLIDALAKEVHDPIAFARGCKDAAKELGVTVTAVKEAVAKRRNELSKAAATALA